MIENGIVSLIYGSLCFAVPWMVRMHYRGLGKNIFLTVYPWPFVATRTTFQWHAVDGKIDASSQKVLISCLNSEWHTLRTSKYRLSINIVRQSNTKNSVNYTPTHLLLSVIWFTLYRKDTNAKGKLTQLKYDLQIWTNTSIEQGQMMVYPHSAVSNAWITCSGKFHSKFASWEVIWIYSLPWVTWITWNVHHGNRFANEGDDKMYTVVM